MTRERILFVPGATLRFREVKSMAGLPSGYQIYRTAKSLEVFLKRIAWKHYYAYGLELRYVLKVQLSPEEFAFTAHLFHKQETKIPYNNETHKVFKLKRTKWSS